MKIQRVIGPIVGSALALLASGAQAAEITVLASTAMKTTLEELAPQFEKATGNKVDITFAPAAALKVKIDDGAAFDVAVLTVPVIDSLAGKIDMARTVIAHSGIGVAIRKGAPRPDISTTEAFKRTLLNAKSIGFTASGATGAYLKTLFERLGIDAELRLQTQAVAGGRGRGCRKGRRRNRHDPDQRDFAIYRRRACWAAAGGYSVLHLLLRGRRGGEQGSRRGQGLHQISRRAVGTGGDQGKGHGAGLIRKFICLASSWPLLQPSRGCRSSSYRRSRR